MSFRPLIVASAIVAGGMALVSAVALTRLPPGAMLPTHWNAAGEADRFGEAGYALFLPVVLTIAVSAILAATPRIEPLQKNLAGSAPLLRTVWAGCLALIIGVEAMVAGPAFGWTPPGSLMLVALGLFLIAIGNTLPQVAAGFLRRHPHALGDHRYRQLDRHPSLRRMAVRGHGAGDRDRRAAADRCRGACGHRHDRAALRRADTGRVFLFPLAGDTATLKSTYGECPCR